FSRDWSSDVCSSDLYHKGSGPQFSAASAQIVEPQSVLADDAMQGRRVDLELHDPSALLVRLLGSHGALAEEARAQCTGIRGNAHPFRPRQGLERLRDEFQQAVDTCTRPGGQPCRGGPAVPGLDAPREAGGAIDLVVHDDA